MDKKAYDEDGFQVLRELLTPAKTSFISKSIDQLWSDWSSNVDAANVMWRDHTSGERRPDRLDPAWRHSPPLDDLIHSEEMMALARLYLNDEPVVFKDKLIMKNPGMQGYDPHQDFPYWARFGAQPGDYVEIMLAIDAADETNGALEFCPGIHQGVLPAPPDEPYDIEPSVIAGYKWVAPALQPGDAVVFHSLAPHRSGVNQSDTPRRAYFMIYVAATVAPKVASFREKITETELSNLYSKLSRSG